MRTCFTTTARRSHLAKKRRCLRCVGLLGVARITFVRAVNAACWWHSSTGVQTIVFLFFGTIAMAFGNRFFNAAALRSRDFPHWSSCYSRDGPAKLGRVPKAQDAKPSTANVILPRRTRLPSPIPEDIESANRPVFLRYDELYLPAPAPFPLGYLGVMAVSPPPGATAGLFSSVIAGDFLCRAGCRVAPASLALLSAINPRCLNRATTNPT